MNIIGIMAPKIISLLTILIPNYDSISKMILIMILGAKLIVDYDKERPGHAGSIYKLIKGLSFDVCEIVVSLVQFIPALFFIMATIILKTWIPAISGIVAVIWCLIQIVSCMKDAINRRRFKRK